MSDFNSQQGGEVRPGLVVTGDWGEMTHSEKGRCYVGICGEYRFTELASQAFLAGPVGLSASFGLERSRI